MRSGTPLYATWVARFAHRPHLLEEGEEKLWVSARAQPVTRTPMPVHVLASACHALLCPHLTMATRGPQCPISPRVLHAEVLWTEMQSNLFVTLPWYLPPWRRLGGERREEDTNGQGNDEPDDLEAHGALLLWETHGDDCFRPCAGTAHLVGVIVAYSRSAHERRRGACRRGSHVREALASSFTLDMGNRRRG
jgi:hypothetical protein